ncbi:MAG: DUF3047 domain-containing protein [Gammaproteobacteria bacterium]|nr:DUF3047 domain-containing protein [Gammaproteobacteria bacterium]
MPVLSSLVRLAGRACLVGAACVVMAACASRPVDTGPPRDRIAVFDPVADGVGGWEHYVLRRASTRYSVVDTPHGPLLRAEGRRSASILIQVLNRPVNRSCGRLTWQWWVEKPQPGADLTDRRRHDVGASIFVAFGDPGVFRDRRVPTLQYVWTNRDAAADAVLTGPYHEEHLRTMIIRRGPGTGGPVTETRDVFADFRRAFGSPAEPGVHAVALFTDNDDTGEPITAYYGPVEFRCMKGDVTAPAGEE